MKFKNVVFVLLFVLFIVILISLTRKPKMQNYIDLLPVGNPWPLRPVEGIEDITVHHTATPETSSLDAIARGHKERWGFGIAYHYCIKQGIIYKTNNWNAYSYHNGYNNKKAIAISVFGNYENIELSKENERALKVLIKYLKREIKSIKYLMSHREYEFATACAGRNIDMNYFREQTNMIQRPMQQALGIAAVEMDTLTGVKWDADN